MTVIVQDWKMLEVYPRMIVHRIRTSPTGPQKTLYRMVAEWMRQTAALVLKGPQYLQYQGSGKDKMIIKLFLLL